MTINITMSKEEFLEYLNYQEFKSKVKCGIIDLESITNELMKEMFNDGIWVDHNKYDKLLKKLITSTDNIKKGAE